MNGQLYNLIKVIDLSNKSLKNMIIDNYKEDKYISSVLFEVPMDNSFINKVFNRNEIKAVASSLMEWCEYLKLRKCKKVYAILGINDNDRNLSAFANGVSGQAMVCVYNKYFEVWRNSFKYNEKNWDVKYSMSEKVNGEFFLEDVDYKWAINSLIESYLQIGNFALEIKEEHWAKFFYNGKENLERMMNNENFDIENLLSNIKWPFGGMGSWNDSPPYSAYQCGKEDEFKFVSDKLYKSLHEAIEAILNKNSV